jgi:amino acid transporter
MGFRNMMGKATACMQLGRNASCPFVLVSELPWIFYYPKYLQSSGCTHCVLVSSARHVSQSADTFATLVDVTLLLLLFFLQIIGVDSSLFVVDIAVLVAFYFAACLFVIGVLSWRHRVRK